MSQQTVVVATDLTPESIALLEAQSALAVKSVPPKTASVRAALQDASAIITRSDFRLDAPLLHQAPKLRLIARMSAGLTGIDIDCASERGILVMNTPGVSAVSAAEHTLMLMLALNRNLPAVHESLREGWWLFDRAQQVGVQLHGKTIGIIGLGRVGAAGGATLPGAGHDRAGLRSVHPPRARQRGADPISQPARATRRFRLCQHARAGDEGDARLFRCVDMLRQMKRGARFINTAHGGIIKEALLAEALLDGQSGRGCARCLE